MRRIIAVGGGDTLKDKYLVYDKLAEIRATAVVQTGEMEGAQRWARRWGKRNGIPVVTVHRLFDSPEVLEPKAAAEGWMFELMPVMVTMVFEPHDEELIARSLDAGVPVYRCYPDRPPIYLLPDGDGKHMEAE